MSDQAYPIHDPLPDDVRAALLEGAAKAVLDKINRATDQLQLLNAKSTAIGFVLGVKASNLPAEGDRFDEQLMAAIEAKEKSWAAT